MEALVWASLKSAHKDFGLRVATLMDFDTLRPGGPDGGLEGQIEAWVFRLSSGGSD